MITTARGALKNIVRNSIGAKRRKYIYKSPVVVVVVVAAPADLIDRKYRPSNNNIGVQYMYVQFCFMQNWFSNWNRTRSTHTTACVRLSAGMSLCSFFYNIIFFFPRNSSEDIPLFVSTRFPTRTSAEVCHDCVGVSRNRKHINYSNHNKLFQYKSRMYIWIFGEWGANTKKAHRGETSSVYTLEIKWGEKPEIRIPTEE